MHAYTMLAACTLYFLDVFSLLQKGNEKFKQNHEFTSCDMQKFKQFF